MEEKLPISFPEGEPAYKKLVGRISATYAIGQAKAAQAVNIQLLETYWQIGQHIVEFEQGGNVRAEYGKALISTLAKDLSVLHGKGFSASNVKRFRQFYLAYPIGATASHQLSWSHVVELLKIEDPLERSFYEKQSQIEKWNVRELTRQKNTALFQRLALSKNKEEILKLSQQGQEIAKPGDILRDPYVFEFLKIPEGQLSSEQELETIYLTACNNFYWNWAKGLPMWAGNTV